MSAAYGTPPASADSEASAEAFVEPEVAEPAHEASAEAFVEPAAARPAPEASAEASVDPATLPGSDSLEQDEERRADAIVDVARAYVQHRPRTLGSGYELVLISSKDQLEHGPGGVGGFLRDGTPVPLHVARMLACDAARVDVTLGEDGELLDVGRRTRTIPSAIGRALWLRNGACRVPGCDRKRHLHAHHVHPWAQGGPTRLSNLVLVCSGHHRMIHEDKLDRFLKSANLHIDPSTNYPKWDGTPMRLGESLDWMLMARS